MEKCITCKKRVPAFPNWPAVSPILPIFESSHLFYARIVVLFLRLYGLSLSMVALSISAGSFKYKFVYTFAADGSNSFWQPSDSCRKFGQKKNGQSNDCCWPDKRKTGLGYPVKNSRWCRYAELNHELILTMDVYYHYTISATAWLLYDISPAIATLFFNSF